MTIKQLGERTPITTAFALTLCYVCYWIGSETSAMRTRLNAVEQTYQQQSLRLDRIEQRLAIPSPAP